MCPTDPPKKKKKKEREKKFGGGGEGRDCKGHLRTRTLTESNGKKKSRFFVLLHRMLINVVTP